VVERFIAALVATALHNCPSHARTVSRQTGRMKQQKHDPASRSTFHKSCICSKRSL